MLLKMGFDSKAFFEDFIRRHNLSLEYWPELNAQRSLGQESVFYKKTKPRDSPIAKIISEKEFPEGTTRAQKLAYARSAVYCGNKKQYGQGNQQNNGDNFLGELGHAALEFLPDLLML